MGRAHCAYNIVCVCCVNCLYYVANKVPAGTPVRRSTQKHNLGSRAIKLPHSGVETQNNNQENKAKQATATENPATADAEPGKPEAKPRTKTVSTSHENNLNVLIIIAGGLAWFLFR